MEPGDAPTTGLSRRHLLSGAGAGAVTLAVAACSSGGDTAAPAGESPATSSGAPSGSGGTASPGGGPPQGLAAVADVPVGGAVSVTDGDGKPVIVAQPAKGDIVAFSAVCTHQGCTVAPQGDQLVCPCHGSTYDLATGDNTGGPAPKPLPGISVTVQDGQVVEG